MFFYLHIFLHILPFFVAYLCAYFGPFFCIFCPSLIITSCILRDRGQDLAHGCLPLGLALLHGLELDQDGVDLGHDGADGVLHAVHATAKAVIRK